MGWTFRGSNPGGGEIFRTRPDRPWGPPSLLYNGYRVFPGSKASRASRLLPTPYSAEVKERVELYLYSTSGSSWPVIEWTLSLPLQNKIRQSGQCIPYSDSLRAGAGCFGVRTLVWERFSALVLTGAKVHTAFSTKSTDSFLGSKEAGGRRFPPTHPPTSSAEVKHG